jgi:hypothetical protein
VTIVKCFYRPSEVPDSVYQPLVQDRHHENSSELFLIFLSSVLPGIHLLGFHGCPILSFDTIPNGDNFKFPAFFPRLAFNQKVVVQIPVEPSTIFSVLKIFFILC